MHCPILAELPPPPPGKTGWPWTEESSQLPNTMPDPSTGSGHAAPWPLVSIVTPSYNQGQFIEETIRSVLLQGYPNLEYIIIDGGSTDGSVEIIRKYEKWLAYWVSEPDPGQAHAINKGLRQAMGEILAWINSDDIYMPNAHEIMAKRFSQLSGTRAIYSDCQVIDESGNHVDLMFTSEFDFEELLFCNYIPQPTVFFRRDVLKEIGFLDPALDYVMDYDFWLRMGHRFRIRRVPDILAAYRSHPMTKSTSQAEDFLPEILTVLDRVFAGSDVPVEMRALRPAVYGVAYVRAALRAFEDARIQQGQKHLAQAFRVNPDLAANPYVLAPLVVRFATSALDPLCFVSTLLAHVPAPARSLLTIGETITRRTEIITGVQRPGQADQVQVRRRVLETILRDAGWIRQRGVAKLLLRAWLGETITHRLVAWKHRLLIFADRSLKYAATQHPRVG